MSFALFPTWIAATASGFAATFFGRHLAFSVTSKTKTQIGNDYRAVAPQLIVMGLLLIASAIGIYRCVIGEAPLAATVLTLVWVVIDFLLLGVVFGAARYRGPGAGVTDPNPPTDEATTALAIVEHETSVPRTTAAEL